LPANCLYLTSDVPSRIVAPFQTVNFKGTAAGGSGATAIVAYWFNFGDGTGTGRIPVSSWPGSAGASHAYAKAGAYQIEFVVEQANGVKHGGANSRCAFRLEVKTNTPTPTPEATPLCAVRPSIYIVGAVEHDRRLNLTGLSWDSAPIDVQIMGPNDADFVTNGSTVADPWGTWVYTTTLLVENGRYQIRAMSRGLYSENDLFYTMASQPAGLNVGMFRAGAGGYAGASDTYINQQSPSINFVDGLTVTVRSEDETDPLATFDLSTIPANARVVMAKLGLYSMDAEPCTKMVASSFQLLRMWDPEHATWISATQSVSWTVPGANEPLVDRLGEPTYTETVRAPFTWYSWDVTKMAQNWVADPSSNFGAIVKAWTYGGEVIHADNNLDQPAVDLLLQPLTNGIGGRRDFAASEYTELRRRPVLYVTYVLP